MLYKFEGKNLTAKDQVFRILQQVPKASTLLKAQN